MKKWNILYRVKKDKNLSIERIIDILLQNRGIGQENKEDFLNPNASKDSFELSGIDKKEYKKFQERIKKSITENERVVIFGDYDVDGICASAILWETLYLVNKKSIPYIPDRFGEGYGLSEKGIDTVIKKFPDTKLIITVDNGIVANKAVSYANKKGIDVIITDHHAKGENLPDAFCILHTTSLCGAGIAWMLAKKLGYDNESVIEKKTELAALATIADLVPLVGFNRSIVKKGIEKLKSTKRPGLIELFKASGLEKEKIDVYSIGYIIAPRLNASGRIENAINSLRLICTKDKEKAKELAGLLSEINRSRQGLTEQMVEHAKITALTLKSSKVTVVAHDSYNQGVIGLVASQLVEWNYRPSIAIAIGDKISKGSARSIKGVNIIELLRSVSSTLIEAGGHPMAAGFSVETHRIDEFIEALNLKAQEVIDDDILTRTINIDLEIDFEIISMQLYKEISILSPFGMGNPEPIFSTLNVEIADLRKIGKDQSHLKLKLRQGDKTFDAIGFKMADKYDFGIGDKVNVAYTIDENVWNGKSNLQLKIRDIKSI